MIPFYHYVLIFHFILYPAVVPPETPEEIESKEISSAISVGAGDVGEDEVGTSKGKGKSAASGAKGKSAARGKSAGGKSGANGETKSSGECEQNNIKKYQTIFPYLQPLSIWPGLVHVFTYVSP